MFSVVAPLVLLSLCLSLSLSLSPAPSLALFAFASADAEAAPLAPAANPSVTVIPFRTEAAPRIDPVFGDVASLRAAIDRFLSLQAEMDRVRDEFSSAVHATLATLATPAATGPEARTCPATSSVPYARALAAGGRYLALAQQLQSAYREIRRGEELGDAVGLTPDYRLKIKKSRDLHQQLLSDYREMRVAFYDQLGAEMRHAGCRPPASNRSTATTPGTAPAVPPDANPADPGSWELAETASEPGAGGASLSKEGVPPAAMVGRRASGTTPTSAEAATAGAAPAIWIDVDNTLCNEPTRLSIDGQALGDIGARNKTSVRALSGPHELCALPASDRRACGDVGTLRKAYLHEGWRLTIHCSK